MTSLLGVVTGVTEHMPDHTVWWRGETDMKLYVEKAMKHCFSVVLSYSLM